MIDKARYRIVGHESCHEFPLNSIVTYDEHDDSCKAGDEWWFVNPVDLEYVIDVTVHTHYGFLTKMTAHSSEAFDRLSKFYTAKGWDFEFSGNVKINIGHYNALKGLQYEII